MFLRSDEDAYGLLRLLTAVELHRNARIYAYYPALLGTANPSKRREESLIPDMLTSDNGRSKWYRSKDRLKAVKAEAISVSMDKEYSSLLVMMALSTVVRQQIFSLYPEIPFNVRKLLHRCLEPQKLSPSEQFSKCFSVLWSRDGNLDNRRGSFFGPNHFVPVIQVRN